MFEHRAFRTMCSPPPSLVYASAEVRMDKEGEEYEKGGYFGAVTAIPMCSCKGASGFEGGGGANVLKGIFGSRPILTDFTDGE